MTAKACRTMTGPELSSIRSMAKRKKPNHRRGMGGMYVGVMVNSIPPVAAFLRFNRKGFFRRPAAIKTLQNGMGGKPDLARPLRRGLGPAVVGNVPVPAGVVVLGAPIRPLTVPGLVVPVVVDALDHFSGARKPEIRNKGFQGVTPPIAHRNPATAVVRIGRNVGIKAPAFDVSPDTENSGFRKAVLNAGLPPHLLIQASTRFGVARSEGRPVSGHLSSATAPARPAELRTGSRQHREDRKPPKGFASQINLFPHLHSIEYLPRTVNRSYW